MNSLKGKNRFGEDLGFSVQLLSQLYAWAPSQAGPFVYLSVDLFVVEVEVTEGEEVGKATGTGLQELLPPRPTGQPPSRFPGEGRSAMQGTNGEAAAFLRQGQGAEKRNDQARFSSLVKVPG